MTISDDKIKELEEKALAIRETIVKMLANAGSGHTAGPLGMTDIFTAFYFSILRHRPEEPMWEDRDRLILSNGHIVPVRYAAMAHAGYFPVSEVETTLRKYGSRFQGHPERTRIPALETTSGPLGSGLGQAAGMAYAAKMDDKKMRIYCCMSDGEQQAGNIWESAMFAGANQLGNLTAVMDRNNIQINGFTEDVMPLEELRDKYEAFGWRVIDVDGHNIRQFIAAVEESKAVYEDPTLILAHTIPGKGIDEIEFKPGWHGKPPEKGQQEESFLRELRTMGGHIEASHLE
jgi:transketolase